VKLRIVSWSCALLILSQQLLAQRIVYVSPKPNSSMVSLQTNIIMRSEAPLDAATVSPEVLDVRGSVSGIHPGTLVVSDDGETLVFTPERALSPGEQVHVSLQKGIRTNSGTFLDPVTFAFRTTALPQPLSRIYAVDQEGAVVPIASLSPLARPSAVDRGVQRGVTSLASLSADSLPSDFPKLHIDTVNSPGPGYYLLATADDVPGIGYFLFMLDNSGKVVKYKRMISHAYDFKQQSNGLYSYGEAHQEWGYAGGSRTVHRLIDSSLAPVDSFKAGNGYDADGHEFQLLSNGHALLHAYDIQYIDLSLTIPGGNRNAIVVGSILQELDLSKNVVFQWRSWDYIPIADTYMSTTASAFDYIHVNAYDIDTDGNILASFRNTCEIVKINRLTGDIMWRMGGKHNQFTFIGENEANSPTYFTYQHTIRRLANGNFTLFDNGNLHPVKVSRGVEYQIDQVSKTATLVWEYKHPSGIFAPNRGSVQRLTNGNTVMGWGGAWVGGVGTQALTEIRPDKSIAFDMGFVDKMGSYRGFKYILSTSLLPAASVSVYDVVPGNTYNFKQGDSIKTGITILFSQAGAGYNRVDVKRYEAAPLKQGFTGLPPFVQPKRWVITKVGIPSFTAEVSFDSTALAPYANKTRAVVYSRDVEGQGTFNPQTSAYDSVKRTLTATVTKFGEFIIGVPEVVGAPPVPTPAAPVQNARVNQTLPVVVRWITSGHITGSHLQIATDSLLLYLVVNDSTLKSSSFVWSSGSPDTRYFWRSSARNEVGTSGWSSVGSFRLSIPYVAVVSPQSGAKVAPGSQTLIEWDSNVGALVAIRLFRNGASLSKIIDSVENTGRYVWKVPATGLPVDSTYTIRVMIREDTTMYADSRPFSIATTAGVDDVARKPDWYTLDQNFPNPFNPTTVIRYGLPQKAAVTLSVFNTLGQLVAELVNAEADAGYHEVSFDGSKLGSGVYFYRIQAGVPGAGKGGSFMQTRKLLLLR
jgi:hypothetical protein